ncbi:MAG: hypothetical protein IPI11_11950 [Haliscomenobacter sp.]|nr:hypothetical protein [Haliscomenobacter sp.]
MKFCTGIFAGKNAEEFSPGIAAKGVGMLVLAQLGQVGQLGKGNAKNAA